VEVQCGPRFVWYEKFEKKKKDHGAQERERSKRSETLRNLKPLFDEEGSVLCGYWTEFR